MTSLSETDANVPDNVGVATAPTLPWHYLAAAVCLSKGTQVTTRSEHNEVVRSLHTDLNKLGVGTTKDDGALRAACYATQAGQAPGGLFSFVRAIGTVAGKAYYGWSTTTPWPTEIPIRLRTNAPDYILGPTGLVVPWPLPNATGQTLKTYHDAVKVVSIPSYGQVGDPVLGTGAAGIWLDPFMRAVDAAIDPCLPTTRNEFALVRNNDAAAKQWLMNWATDYNSSFEVPDDLTVHVDEDKTTPMTAWEIRGGNLHLEMGWKPQPGRELCKKGAMEIAVDKWPCGAFTGM